VVVNRLWNLWCELSGSDPGDSRQKTAFNMDRRVATLSSHDADLVEGFAVYVWSTGPGMSKDDFLDQWLSEVTEDLCRREEVAARLREEQAADEERRPQSAQAVIHREREEQERRRLEAEAEQRRLDEAAQERLRAEQSARAVQDRHRTVAARSQVFWLYNIAPIANIARIASRGILCHDLVADIPHEDLSDVGVQDRRDGRWIDGKPLHSFANLYINPRNAMLFRLHKRERRDVVVIQVSAEVLDEPGVVVCDGNAASSASKWWRAAEGLANVDLARVRSETWLDLAGAVDPEFKRVTQAEVLVPGHVPPKYIEGFLAPSPDVVERAGRMVGHWQGRVDRYTFFETEARLGF